MQDLEYIKKFSKISITRLCKENKVDRANLLSNRTSKEKTHLIRESIENEIAKLYIKQEGKNG